MRGIVTRGIAAAGLCAVIAAGSCATAAAFGRSYYLPEAGEMNITVPGDLITITREASENDAYFSTFHLDYSATMQDFQTNDIYLQGMDSSASLTVTVTMVESAESQSVGSYGQLSAEQMSEIAKSFLKDPSYTACRVDKSGKEINWLHFDTLINGSKGLLANTVVNGKSFNVSMNRNGSDVTEEDGKTFESMVSGVTFGKRSFFDRYGMMILVAIAAIMVIAVITMIIIRVVRSRSGEKKPTVHGENERILEELAGKYARKPVVSQQEAQSAETAEPVSEAEPEDSAEETPAEELDPEEPDGEEPPVQLPEAEILGAEDIEEFADDDDDVGELAQAEEEPPEEPESKPAAEAEVKRPEPEDYDFFEGSELSDGEETETADEAVEAAQTVRIEADKPEEEDAPAQPVTQAAEKPEPVSEVPAEAEDNKTEEAEEAEAEEAEEAKEETADAEETDAEDEEPDEFEEYMNDEVLVRQDVKSNKFRSSSDFFDEAPRKSVGVINSRDLAEAEEYDVIGEEEKRAEEVKREEPKKKKKKSGGGFKAFLLGFIAGCKNFFTHCGYFITNVRREIKRSRAKKKRKKAEEERRRRARERAARQRAMEQQRGGQPRRPQRTDSGLVQVRSRGDRRPSQQNGNRRPPQQGSQRRPSQGRPPQKRRPSSSRPPQKRGSRDTGRR